MAPKDFVKTNLSYARECETETGISAVFTLAQAAVESGWGDRAPGNMYFGIKAGPGWKGLRQLLTTTEYHLSPNIDYPEVINVEKVAPGRYKYKVKDWFRAYLTPAESFKDHAQFFLSNPRYGKALKHRNNPVKFAIAIAKAGYATSPLYAKTLVSVIDRIDRIIKEQECVK